MESSIIPLLEGLLEALYSSLQNVHEKWSMDLGYLVLVDTLYEENGSISIYSRKNDIMGDARGQIRSYTKDLIILRPAYLHPHLRHPDEKNKEEAYVIEIYVEDFIIGAITETGDPIGPYVNLANYGLNELSSDLQDILKETDWTNDEYRLVPRIPTIFFDFHYNVIPHNAIYEPYLDFHEQRGNMRGLVLTLPVDILNEEEYAIGGKKYLKAQEEFGSIIRKDYK